MLESKDIWMTNIQFFKSFGTRVLEAKNQLMAVGI